MAYKTNEVIKTELEALSVAYDDEMTNKELQDLLDEATEKQVTPEVRKEPVEVKEVCLGVATIQDHEKRITELEQKLA